MRLPIGLVQRLHTHNLTNFTSVSADDCYRFRYRAYLINTFDELDCRNLTNVIKYLAAISKKLGLSY